jgi:hypothetical protein
VPAGTGLRRYRGSDIYPAGRGEAEQQAYDSLGRLQADLGFFGGEERRSDGSELSLDDLLGVGREPAELDKEGFGGEAGEEPWPEAADGAAATAGEVLGEESAGDGDEGGPADAADVPAAAEEED